MNTLVKQKLGLAEKCSEQEYLDAIQGKMMEFDGWVWYDGWHNPNDELDSRNPDNYLNDLNAVARVEHKYADANDKIFRLYEDVLDSVVPQNQRWVLATALQRCEAVILTLCP